VRKELEVMRDGMKQEEGKKLGKKKKIKQY
jgi:hypothetical protein